MTILDPEEMDIKNDWKMVRILKNHLIRRSQLPVKHPLILRRILIGHSRHIVMPIAVKNCQALPYSPAYRIHRASQQSRYTGA